MRGLSLKSTTGLLMKRFGSQSKGKAANTSRVFLDRDLVPKTAHVFKEAIANFRKATIPSPIFPIAEVVRGKFAIASTQRPHQVSPAQLRALSDDPEFKRMSHEALKIMLADTSVAEQLPADAEGVITLQGLCTFASLADNLVLRRIGNFDPFMVMSEKWSVNAPPVTRHAFNLVESTAGFVVLDKAARQPWFTIENGVENTFEKMSHKQCALFENIPQPVCLPLDGLLQVLSHMHQQIADDPALVLKQKPRDILSFWFNPQTRITTQPVDFLASGGDPEKMATFVKENAYYFPDQPVFTKNLDALWTFLNNIR